MGEQADRYAYLWQGYKDGLLNNDELNEFMRLLVKQADRREAGSREVVPPATEGVASPSDQPVTGSASPSATIDLAEEVHKGLLKKWGISPSAYHQKLAEEIDDAIDEDPAEMLNTRRFYIAAVLATEQVVDPEETRRYIHDIETRCDPSGEVTTIAQLREDRGALAIDVTALRAKAAEQDAEIAACKEAITIDSSEMEAVVVQDNIRLRKQMGLAAKYISRYYETDRNPNATKTQRDHDQQMVFAIGADLKNILEQHDLAALRSTGDKECGDG